MTRKSKDQIGRERAERWRRYGTLGQFAYAKAMFQQIARDPNALHLHKEAIDLQHKTQQLLNKYKETFK